MGLASELREIVHEQVEYRELLFQMTLRDLLLRYKQTVMGFGWAVFMPLINTVVFSVDVHAGGQDRDPRALPVVRLLRACWSGTSLRRRCGLRSDR